MPLNSITADDTLANVTPHFGKPLIGVGVSSWRFVVIYLF